MANPIQEDLNINPGSCGQADQFAWLPRMCTVFFWHLGIIPKQVELSSCVPVILDDRGSQAYHPCSGPPTLKPCSPGSPEFGVLSAEFHKCIGLTLGSPNFPQRILGTPPPPPQHTKPFPRDPQSLNAASHTSTKI